MPCRCPLEEVHVALGCHPVKSMGLPQRADSVGGAWEGLGLLCSFFLFPGLYGDNCALPSADPGGEPSSGHWVGGFVPLIPSVSSVDTARPCSGRGHCYWGVKGDGKLSQS